MKFLTNIVTDTVTLPSLAVVMVFGLAAAAYAQPDRLLAPSESFHSVILEKKGEELKYPAILCFLSCLLMGSEGLVNETQSLYIHAVRVESQRHR